MDGSRGFSPTSATFLSGHGVATRSRGPETRAGGSGVGETDGGRRRGPVRVDEEGLPHTLRETEPPMLHSVIKSDKCGTKGQSVPSNISFHHYNLCSKLSVSVS